MCFSKNFKAKNLSGEYNYIVSALHIDPNKLKADTIDKLIENIYDELKPFFPHVEQDMAFLEEYLMLSLKQQAVWGAYLRARELVSDYYVGIRELLFLEESGFEWINQYIKNAVYDKENGQQDNGIFFEKLYNRDMLVMLKPLPQSSHASKNERELGSAINAFRNRLSKLKTADCYSRIFLDINTDEKHYSFPIYNVDLINSLVPLLGNFESRLEALTKIKDNDMSEEKQKAILACCKAHQKLADAFKIFESGSTQRQKRDILAFNYMLESFYHVEYLQKALKYRKENNDKEYLFSTMLEHALIANAELPNSFFRDAIVRQEIDYHKTNFYRKKNTDGKNSLVSFYEEEALLMPELESMLFWTKRTAELPKIMSRLVYPAAEILLCYSLAADEMYENAFGALKKYICDHEFLFGRGFEAFLAQDQTTFFEKQSTGMIQSRPAASTILETLFRYTDEKIYNKDEIEKHYTQMIITAKESAEKIKSAKPYELNKSDFLFLYHFYLTLFTTEKAQKRKRILVSSNIRNAGRMDNNDKNVRNVQEHFKNSIASAIKELLVY